MINYYTGVLKKYAVFEGRARRAEYWYFVLANFIAALILYIIGAIIHTQILYTLYILALIIPSIAVSVRRLHDTGRSGWWLLIDFIPFIGAIILIVWCAMDSTPGSNKYGPNPKGVAGPAAAPAEESKSANPAV